MAKKRSKKFIHNNRKKPGSEFEKFLQNFTHEDKELQSEIRKIGNAKFNLSQNPNKYKGTLSDDFQAMVIAEMVKDTLKEMRKELGFSAQQLDVRLGFSIGYPMASIMNTRNRPTAKNWKIFNTVNDRMIKLFPDLYKKLMHAKPGETRLSDRLIDINQILEDAIVIHGYNKSIFRMNKENNIEVKVENDNESVTTVKDEPKNTNKGDDEMTMELKINGVVIEFEESDKVLDVMAKVKERANIDIEVYETVKERII